MRSDYAPTPLGRTLLPVMTAIKDCAETHLDDVHDARERYDAGREGGT